LMHRIGELEKLVELSRCEGEQVNHLFDLALDMFCVFGFDGVFRRVNPAFERTLGFSAQDLTSRPFIEFVHPNDKAATMAVADYAYTTGEPVFGFENRFATRDGSWRWISWDATTVLLDKIVYSVGRDVTELKQTQEELRRAKDLLESQVQERTEKLVQVNQNLRKEIVERRKTLRALRTSQARLAEKSTHLQEVNSALRVLLKKREEDQSEMAEKVLYNVMKMALPCLEYLKRTDLNKQQQSLVSVMESILEEITSGFSRHLALEFLNLTPSEIQIAKLINLGQTTQEIADFYNVSVRTVETHRYNLRKKIGIKSKRTNLRTWLLRFKNNT
jgi:PAS domain S-box-containing protein